MRRSYERCGEILPVLEETEEIIMLGGAKEDWSKATNKQGQSLISNARKSVMSNVDDVIESVVKDVSGVKTGGKSLDTLKISSSSSKIKSPTSTRVTKITNLPAKTNFVAKPAPASKKKFLQSLPNCTSKLDVALKEILEQDTTLISSQPITSSHNRINDVISTVINDVYVECSVATVDLFHDSPLEKLVCMGCLRNFNGQNMLPSDKAKDVYTLESFR